MLSNCEEWLNGPVFEICIAFCDQYLCDYKLHISSTVLKLLNIEGPWDEPEHVGNSEYKLDNWMMCPVSYGLWRINRGRLVNVKIIPSSFRHYHYHLLLCIPPKSVNKYYRGYPWIIKPDWAIQPVITFHEHIMTICRNLHMHKLIKTVYLWQEDWSQALYDNVGGFILYNDVAVAAGMKGKRVGDLFFNVPF